MRAALLAILLIAAQAGPADAAFPGQNGKVAFESDSAGSRDIWVMNPDGTGRVQSTTNPADDLVPAWSPDGTRIAFRTDRDGNYEIYVMNADGSGQTRLTDNTAADTNPAWSPDGTKIVFTGGFQMIVMNADGTGQTPLIEGREPAWSPDGTKIAFTDGAEINVVNLDGTGRTQVTPTGDPGCRGAGDPGRETSVSPNWAPDGHAIAFHHRSPVDDEDCDQIDVINIDGTGRTTVAGGFVPTVDPGSFFLREPAWSPDGTRIAFAHEATHIDTVAPNGADRIHLDPMPVGFVFSPDWQPIVSLPPPPGPQPSDYKNAAKFCKAERDFLGDGAFANKYGGNGNGANAYGNCVSGK